MKTSTMLILTALLIILGSLAAFNYTIKAAYLTGAYKNRFKEMDFTAFIAVEKLNLQTEKLSSIQIEYGDKEGIWISKNIKDLVKFDVKGNVLNLSTSETGKRIGSQRVNGMITIVTKKLNAITTTPYYILKKDESYWPGTSEISLKGYHLGQLDLQIASFVDVSLNQMDIQTLNATVGTKTSRGSELTLSEDTKINNATLNVPGESKLNLLDPKIVKTNYLLSDSATVSLNGKVVQMIK
ncbi:hypothetical protein HDE68_000637 [Pedobacter cryoconitis]|uniref:Uncharacterized protein n=1 Tax=Pedobacter cryoconitis TaxID=188932 RepID=A0A7W8ZIS3_9SPHI|nr:hypothetical protein [Pedobacter cryoconitis]MBB5634752.1 hypothetical protein [Pedobacter cryoconitis]